MENSTRMNGKETGKIVSLEQYRKRDISEAYDETYDKITRKCIKFAVRMYAYEDLITKEPVEYPLIVIVDTRIDIVLHHTGLEHFVLYSADKNVKRKQLHKMKANKSTLLYIVKMLNYILIDHYEKYHIKNVAYLTYDAVQDYLCEYAKTPYAYAEEDFGLARRPLKETVERAERVIARFCENLMNDAAMMNFKEGFYMTYTVKNRKGQIEESKRPVFHTPTYKENRPPRTQDLPDKIAFRMLALARQEDPGIAFAMANAMFAGLREGEIVNMYRTNTVTKTKGVRVDKENGHVEIDLENSVVLTKTLKYVGVVKRPRYQDVFPDFIEVYIKLYEEHMEYINEISHETEDGYEPMFYNRQKRNGVYEVMTVRGYRYRWNELFKKVVNECSLSDDPEMRAFAKIATEQSFTPHSMRHWYSVYVALNTNNAIELKEWRGDKAIESVEPYLTDKAMIKGRVKNAVNKLSDYTRSMADTIWGGN